MNHPASNSVFFFFCRLPSRLEDVSPVPYISFLDAPPVA
jgi:hypothetical protein